MEIRHKLSSPANSVSASIDDVMYAIAPFTGTTVSLFFLRMQNAFAEKQRVGDMCLPVWPVVSSGEDREVVPDGRVHQLAMQHLICLQQ